MTGYACATGQAVIVIDVAIGALAWWNRVQTGKGESGCGVVKFRVNPCDRVMAALTRRGEARVRYGSCGVVVIGLMATDARSVGDVVVIVDVAIRALPGRHGVRSGKWEPGLGMIERSRLPRRGVVAELASLRESPSHVVGIGCTLEILQMA